MAQEHHAHASHVHHSHAKAYVAVYLALLALVLATVAAAYIPLGPLAFPVCISIALAKTFLIVWIFMHVKDEFPLIQVFAFMGFAWFMVLLTFLLADYLTRSGMQIPARQEETQAARQHYLETGGHHRPKSEHGDSHGAVEAAH